MVKSDKAFSRALKNSEEAVMRVYEWLEGWFDFDLFVPEQRERPSFEERWQYVDDGDIILTENGISRRIEVKGRNFDFTCAEDFKYPTIFIDEVYKVEKRPMGTLAAYFIVSKSLRHAAIIFPSSREYWLIENKYDPTNRDCRDTYTCPKQYATFVVLGGKRAAKT